jgi:hypothetical protein
MDYWQRATKPVKLPEAIMATGASTKQSTSVTILNRTSNLITILLRNMGL